MCVILVELRYGGTCLALVGRYALILCIHPRFIMVTGVIVKLYLGAHAQDLHQGGILTYQHTVRCGGTSHDYLVIGEQLRIVLNHTAGYVTVLLHTLLGKVAGTLVSLGTDYLQAAQHILSEIGQRCRIIGLLEYVVRTVIV